MGDLKSLLSLWKATVVYRCGELVSDKSIEYVEKRTLEEGISFLTTSLPKLGKALLACINGETFIVPPGYRLASKHMPRLFNELFSLIISSEGHIRIDCSESFIAKVVGCLNDITFFAYKLELPFTPNQESMAVDKWLKANNLAHSYTYDYYTRVPNLDKARILIHRILGCHDPFDITPTHASGAVAEGSKLDPHKRWHRAIPWGKKLDNYFPHSEYYFVNLNHLSDDLDFCELEDSQVARISFVPKDSRGPRTICCEPAGSQFIQQGLMNKMYDIIDTSVITDVSYIGYPTRKITLAEFIPLRDQSVMQDLAQYGSITGDVATLDLESASDSIPWNLVKYLFPTNWVAALHAVRSDYADFPVHTGIGRQPLNMAFPMGSSVCFPIEALIFWAICHACGNPGSNTWCYGDDLIVESENVDSVISVLRKCGFTVNVSKSFFQGPFRESCGADYLYGENVRATYLRRWDYIPGPLARNCSFAASISGYINQIYSKGCISTPRRAVLPHEVIDTIVRIPYSENQTIGYHFNSSRNAILLRHRYSKDYQRDQFLYPVMSTKKGITLSGWDGVRRALLSPSRASVSVVRYDTHLRWSWI